jgi:hypothetical protein
LGLLQLLRIPKVFDSRERKKVLPDNALAPPTQEQVYQEEALQGHLMSLKKRGEVARLESLIMAAFLKEMTCLTFRMQDEEIVVTLFGSVQARMNGYSSDFDYVVRKAKPWEFNKGRKAQDAHQPTGKLQTRIEEVIDSIDPLAQVKETFANVPSKATLEMDYHGRGIDCRLSTIGGAAHDDDTFCDSLVAKFILFHMPVRMHKLFMLAVEWAKGFRRLLIRKRK